MFNIEPLWQTIRGPASLVELAVDQKATNYGLLLHHYLLCQFMYAILKFGLKSVKVLSLFDCKVGILLLFSHLYISQFCYLVVLFPIYHF